MTLNEVVTTSSTGSWSSLVEKNNPSMETPGWIILMVNDRFCLGECLIADIVIVLVVFQFLFQHEKSVCLGQTFYHPDTGSSFHCNLLNFVLNSFVVFLDRF